MQRRQFLKTAALAGTTALLGERLAGIGLAQPGPATAAMLARHVPRWRGFNLLEKFNAGGAGPFQESDFRWIHEWGFDFVRLPMDYRCWTDKADPYKIDEKVLKEIDQAVELGRQHAVHVCLCLHRAPGYTVAKPAEKLDLWTSEEAQRQFDFQWSHMAQRYRGVASTGLSFNLVNEPGRVPKDAYVRVVRRVAAAIRKGDPDRLIIADGLSWGRDPVYELADLGIIQSTRGYDPFGLTHYQAAWVGGQKWSKPTWPLKQGDKLLDRAWLYRDRIEPWKKLEAQGGGVHVGEWGAFNHTPHDVVLPWMRDVLGLWREAGWGWALWNFRGSFGILDSGRSDTAYDDFHGHKLDRRMLELLREF